MRKVIVLPDECLGRDVPFCKQDSPFFWNREVPGSIVPTNHNQAYDRTRGCILGSAVGDAIGGAFEGQTGPLEFDDQQHWRISDDTQLTLATCESIIELRGTVEPEHIAGRFVQWFRERRLSGMGSSSLKALRDLDTGLHRALAGAKGEMAAGNGAAMRIAPLSFHIDPKRAEDR